MRLFAVIFVSFLAFSFALFGPATRRAKIRLDCLAARRHALLRPDRRWAPSGQRRLWRRLAPPSVATSRAQKRRQSSTKADWIPLQSPAPRPPETKPKPSGRWIVRRVRHTGAQTQSPNARLPNPAFLAAQAADQGHLTQLPAALHVPLRPRPLAAPRCARLSPSVRQALAGEPLDRSASVAARPAAQRSTANAFQFPDAQNSLPAAGVSTPVRAFADAHPYTALHTTFERPKKRSI